jgi:hypothetical protein
MVVSARNYSGGKTDVAIQRDLATYNTNLHSIYTNFLFGVVVAVYHVRDE